MRRSARQAFAAARGALLSGLLLAIGACTHIDKLSENDRIDWGHPRGPAQDQALIVFGLHPGGENFSSVFGPTDVGSFTMFWCRFSPRTGAVIGTPVDETRNREWFSVTVNHEYHVLGGWQQDTTRKQYYALTIDPGYYSIARIFTNSWENGEKYVFHFLIQQLNPSYRTRRSREVDDPVPAVTVTAVSPRSIAFHVEAGDAVYLGDLLFRPDVKRDDMHFKAEESFGYEWSSLEEVRAGLDTDHPILTRLTRRPIRRASYFLGNRN